MAQTRSIAKKNYFSKSHEAIFVEACVKRRSPKRKNRRRRQRLHCAGAPDPYAASRHGGFKTNLTLFPRWLNRRDGCAGNLLVLRIVYVTF